MFIELRTAKDERIGINTDKILFIAETKKGSTVVIDDGTPIELTASYEEVFPRLAFLFSGTGEYKK